MAHYIVVYILVAQTIRRRGQVRRVAHTIVGVGSFLALFGLVKYLAGISPWWWDYEVQSKGLTATFVNRNHLAGYMAMALPVAIGLLIAARRGWQKALYGFLIFFLCAAMTLSLSRGGWVSAVFALGLMLCLYVARAKKHHRGLMGGTVAMVTVVVLTAFASSPVIERLETLTHGEGIGKREGRPVVWAKTVDLIKDHPRLGTGPGTFPIAFTPYRPAGVNAKYHYAHNDYLHFVSETGLFTMGIILWLAVAVFRSATGKIRAAKSRLTLGITLGALAGMVAIMVHSLVDFNLHIMANATLFSVLAGLVVSATGAPSTLARCPLPFQASGSRALPVFRAVLSVAVFGLFVLGAHFLYAMFMGDYYIGRAEATARTKAWNTAVGAYEKAIDHVPSNPEYRYLFGRFYLTFAKRAKDAAVKERLLQTAWAELEQARRGSPSDAPAYLALAQTAEELHDLGRSAEAPETYFQKAVSLYPNSASYRYVLARYYKRAGALEKALHHLSTMLTLDPATDRYIRHHPFWDIPNIDKAAEKALERALANHFTRNAAAKALAARLAEEKNWLEAARVYACQIPKSAFADRSRYYIQMGAYLLLGGQEEKAEVSFLRALEGASDLAPALKGVKAAYQKAEKPAQLFALFETFKRRRPDRMEIDLYWAQVLYGQRRYEEAQAHLDSFLKRKETAEADLWMAKTWKALGDDYKAEAYIKQAIKWEPQKALFRHFYSGLLYDGWRFSEALDQADAAVRASQGGNAQYLDRKAWILYRMKRYEASIEIWQRAVQLKPGHQAFRRHIEMAERKADQAFP